ncbi:hypothetical protein NS303_21945 [Pantoea ananatis]|nr:hypothetical protein NS303_21945 [Pantoea ananatis]KTR49796.1 hypothetical protein NS311_21880 [Pantoea ananatis]KTR62010.1 hypothetical protein RSA47_21970 [Pantoea ananatis]KTR67379.1 hypothetical protein NS296_22175 [Pantoea ananatis]
MVTLLVQLITRSWRKRIHRLDYLICVGSLFVVGMLERVLIVDVQFFHGKKDPILFKRLHPALIGWFSSP